MAGKIDENIGYFMFLSFFSPDHVKRVKLWLLLSSLCKIKEGVLYKT